MNKQIKHTWFFAHPTDVIWEYLTRSDLIGQWLMVNDFKPIVGHQFTFRSEACHPMAFDGNVYWEITLDSVVVWSLQPKNGGTELILEHTGFTEPNNLLDYQTMEPGWKGHVNRIQGLISTKYENAATIY
jgi:Activator of Hsp90 ATPase homolog 1-like protein